MVTCGNRAAHDAKFGEPLSPSLHYNDDRISSPLFRASAVSKLYRKKSGLVSPNALARAPIDPLALLERTRNLSAGRRGIMGDALQRKLSAQGTALVPAPPAKSSPGGSAQPVGARSAAAAGDGGDDADDDERRAPRTSTAAAPLVLGSPSAAAAAGGGLDAQRAYVSAFIGQFARTGVRTHIELLDREYYDEMRRRFEAVVASGAKPASSSFVGVKPTSRPGGGHRFIARVSLSQVCIHLGSFGSSAEGTWEAAYRAWTAATYLCLFPSCAPLRAAAVAFDYGTTYLRGANVPSVNFPGSASDCRTRGPIDPWPQPIADAMAAGHVALPAHEPLPGEEGRYAAGPGPQAAAVGGGGGAGAGGPAPPSTRGTGPAAAVATTAKRRRAVPAALAGGEFDTSGGMLAKAPLPPGGRGRSDVAQGEWSDDEGSSAGDGSGSDDNGMSDIDSDEPMVGVAARRRAAPSAQAPRGGARTGAARVQQTRAADDDDDDDEDEHPRAEPRKRVRSSGGGAPRAVVPFAVRYAQAAAAAGAKSRSEYIGVSASNAACTRWAARATSNNALRQIGTYDSQVRA